jgi:prolyl oligopeptidase
MRQPIAAPPCTQAEPVSETLHGVWVTDPFRWLEDANSPRTREWLSKQTRYARSHLDGIPGRNRIRERIQELLAIDTYDSLQKAGSRYFFLKRLAHEEQPSIYMRDGAHAADELLIDPSERGTGSHTAVKPLYASPDGGLLLYEVKQGGERSARFELLDVRARKVLSDALPRGYLRGFSFHPDGKSFCYVHEAHDSPRPFHQAAYRHVLGAPFREDEEIFHAGEGKTLRLHLISDRTRLGFLVYRFLEETRIDFYLKGFASPDAPQRVIADFDHTFAPRLVQGRIFALTDHEAPNFRIVELALQDRGEARWLDVVAEAEWRIHRWMIAANRIFVTYVRGTQTHVSVFDLSGENLGELPVRSGETLRLTPCSPDTDELLFETESFTEPLASWRYSSSSRIPELWAKRACRFQSSDYAQIQVSYRSKDGTDVPMSLLGRREVVDGGTHPTIMTAYGGSGVSMTPQFSVFVAYLIEQGCLFALPNIRGGSEFGVRWHESAKRRNRQNAYDDFLSAAEWLIHSGRTRPEQLAIFGGSNSGLLVGVALTQRPELFRAAVCMAPILDMLRYHLFDGAVSWRGEFGTADDPADFRALSNYSPYHHVRQGVSYPATMIISGDADGTCNPLHARKMTAMLQGANASPHPILLDWNPHRGHSPVLPLRDRIEALTDRIAFLSGQLQLAR